LDESIHIPVMLTEVVHWLQPQAGGIYVDCTLGPAGTASSILEACAPDGRLIGIDQDPQAIELARKQLQDVASRVRLYCDNFSHVKSILVSAGLSQVDGLLFDLGVSSVQLADESRGLSFLHDGPLNMRLNAAESPTAADLVNSLTESELANLIFTYGEERYSRRIAKAISRARALSPLRTTMQLEAIIWGAVPSAYRHGRIHPATRTFQALRIAVNKELEILEGALRDAIDMLAPGGRLCVISFHSLEDRIVKLAFRTLSGLPDALISILTKKPCIPSDDERQRNPRARSAKMRVVERKPLLEKGCPV